MSKNVSTVVQQFQFKSGKKIRSVVSNGEIWFLSKDICELLEINQIPKALSKLDRDEIKIAKGIDSSGQQIDVKIINESGFYNLIFQSNSTNSKKIKKWITSEVLPNIRQNGIPTKSGELTFVQRFWDNFDRVDPGYFSVIGELLWHMYAKFEKLGHVIPIHSPNSKEIWPDISVGRLFSSWLKSKHPNKQNNYKTYTHLIRGRARPNVRQYPNSMLPLFREFLDEEWLPHHAAAYFATRDPEILELIPKLLERHAK